MHSTECESLQFCLSDGRRRLCHSRPTCGGPTFFIGVAWLEFIAGGVIGYVMAVKQLQTVPEAGASPLVGHSKPFSRACVVSAPGICKALRKSTPSVGEDNSPFPSALFPYMFPMSFIPSSSTSPLPPPLLPFSFAIPTILPYHSPSTSSHLVI